MLTVDDNKAVLRTQMSMSTTVEIYSVMTMTNFYFKDPGRISTTALHTNLEVSDIPRCLALD